MKNMKPLITPLLAMAAAIGLLAGCNRDDNRTTGQKVDSAIATSTQKSDAAVDKAGAKIEQAGDRMAVMTDDVSITTKINAELAKDPALSALRINVDTSAGRVTLNGSAPTAAARDRATQLANGVSGVKAVENKLEVRG